MGSVCWSFNQVITLKTTNIAGKERSNWRKLSMSLFMLIITFVINYQDNFGLADAKFMF